jgi:hypothetical protein
MNQLKRTPREYSIFMRRFRLGLLSCLRLGAKKIPARNKSGSRVGPISKYQKLASEAATSSGR